MKVNDFSYFCRWVINAGKIMGRNIIRRILFLLAIACISEVQAQEDSTRLTKDSILLQREGKLSAPVKSGISEDKSYHFSTVEPMRPLPKFTLPKREPDLRLPYQENPSPMFKGDFSTGGPMVRWRTGALDARGNQISMPGLGRLNEAAFGFQQELNDRLTLQATANAIKLNMAYFTTQSFNLSGTLVYRAQDHLWFTAFGTVSTGGIPNLSPYSYGGTMGFDITDRFSLELGVQRYYDSGTGHWEMRPIVMPGYRFNNGFKLELDVGPIIYEVIRSIVIDHKDHRGGPTIRPDVPGFR